jgi:hypothetical protein
MRHSFMTGGSAARIWNRVGRSAYTPKEQARADAIAILRTAQTQVQLYSACWRMLVNAVSHLSN